VFLSDDSNRELGDLIARGDLVAVQQALQHRRDETHDNTRWLELSADMVKVFVQQSHYAEAERTVDEIEARLRQFHFRRRTVAALSALLCFAYVILPGWASRRFARMLARLSRLPTAST
jgi:hypothetical protein